MRKIIIVILLNLFLLIGKVYAEETSLLDGYVIFDTMPDNTIYLDENIYKPTVNLEQEHYIKPVTRIQDHSVNLLGERSIFSNHFDVPEYKRIAPVLYGATEKSDYFSYGALYGSDVDSSSAQLEYMANIYTKFDSKYLAFATAYSTVTGNSSDLLNQSFILSPEIKLTKSLSIVDNFQVYMGRQRKKNELVLRYSPHFSEYSQGILFEFGGGQTFYETGVVSSFLRFSTKFKL